MAKQIKKQTYLHINCRHCCPVDEEFLSLRGRPILGHCIHAETRFLLKEKTECKNFKDKDNGN